jgi:hypothetical protein
MLQPRGGSGFALEPFDEIGVEGEREGQDFYGDLTIQLLIPGTEYDRHPPAAKLFGNLVLVPQGVTHHLCV